MFKTNVSGHNTIWRTQKYSGGTAPECPSHVYGPLRPTTTWNPVFVQPSLIDRICFPPVLLPLISWAHDQNWEQRVKTHYHAWRIQMWRKQIQRAPDNVLLKIFRTKFLQVQEPLAQKLKLQESKNISMDLLNADCQKLRTTLYHTAVSFQIVSNTTTSNAFISTEMKNKRR